MANASVQGIVITAWTQHGGRDLIAPVDAHDVLTKTAKGMAEASGKTTQLSRALRNLLKEIDGRTPIADLAEKLTRFPEAELLDTLKTLEQQGFVRRLPRKLPPADEAVPADEDLDFTALASAPAAHETDYFAARRAVMAREREQANAIARAEGEAAARAAAEAEAAAKAKADAETAAQAESKRAEAAALVRAHHEAKVKQSAQARAKAEAEAAELRRALEHERKAREEHERKAKEDAERAVRETEERVRREAEDRARREAAERAVREAELREAKARLEIEESARRQAVEQARREAEELRANLEAERTAREADALARASAEERIRKEIDERTQRETEERAQREAAERAQRDADAQARAAAEERVGKEIDERTQREAAERAEREAAERAGREAELREAKKRLEVEESAHQQAVEQARREADELRAKLEVERNAREDAERQAREVAERQSDQQSQHRRPETSDFGMVATPQLAIDAAQAKQAADERAEEVARRFHEEQSKRHAIARAQREEAERERAARDAELGERARAAKEAKQQRLHEDQERRRAAEDAERRHRDEQARAQIMGMEKTREAAAAMLARKPSDGEEWPATEPRRMGSATAPRPAEPASRAPRRARRPSRIAAVLLLLVVGALAASYFMPLPLDAASFEREATARFGAPVKIGSAHLSLVPMPALVFERVSIGPAGDVRIAKVASRRGAGAVFDRQNALKALEFDGVQIPASWVGAVLWGKSGGGSSRLDRVIARGVKVEAPGLELPGLTVEAKLDSGGALQSLSAHTADGIQTFTLTMSDGKAAVEISARNFRLPFPGAVQLGDLVGVGTLTLSELTLGKFYLGAFGGSAKGNARVRWGASWSVEGEFNAASMDPNLATASLVPTGRLEGKGAFSMRALTPHKLHEAARVDAAFTIRNGTLGFVDLTRALQAGNAHAGTTSFASLDGNASFAGGTVRLTQLRLAAGLLNAAGDATVDPAKNLIGRLEVSVASQARGVLSLGGTVLRPHVRR